MHFSFIRDLDDGVIVIPAHLIDDVVGEATEMTLFEDFVLEKINEGNSIIGLYPPTNKLTLKSFESWKKQKGST